ncbi:ester cyclase [Pendulispora albinea]|uniref:Ester cyclase n=1 Tax=Pendulispora albinea TaxID=2741071 RepID=A0ABZ2LU09_9BACT
MDTESARAFYLDYLDTVYHRRQIRELDRFFSKDLVVHPPFPGALDFAGVKAAAAALLDTFSDCRLVPETFVYANGMLASRLVCSGTYAGRYFGVGPSGHRIDVIAHPQYRVQNGKFVELWDCTDMLGLIRQIGEASFPRVSSTVRRVRRGVAWLQGTKKESAHV